MREVAKSLPPNCPCCGRDFDMEVGRTARGAVKDGVPSFDRIDSTGGYIRGNVAVICWRCNCLKRNGTIADFENLVRYMKANGAKHGGHGL